MSSFTRSIIEPFDFRTALKLNPGRRIDEFLKLGKRRVKKNGYFLMDDLPAIGPGASDEEIDHWAHEQQINVPLEYRILLRKARYVAIDDGLTVWGLPHKGIGIGTPWISDEHMKGFSYLVFGYYWRFADGDQLMIDLNDPSLPTVAYLHEYPAVEYFAPSFSLALWRMVHEAS